VADGLATDNVDVLYDRQKITLVLYIVETGGRIVFVSLFRVCVAEHKKLQNSPAATRELPFTSSRSAHHGRSSI